MKENIRKLRIKQALSQTALAEKLGYKKGSIVSMWESGERTPPVKKLLRLAEILNCSVDELLKNA